MTEGESAGTTPPPMPEDETGILTESFNEMIAGSRERERMKDTFGKYMTEEAIDYLLRESVLLGGEEREITVLFPYVHDFSDIVAGMTPAEETAFLNDYYQKIVPPVLSAKGRIDHYRPMDGSMQVDFAAPIPRPDHSLRAVRAAVEMRSLMHQLNVDRRQQGLPVLDFGIGIHTGKVLVGNIGTEERLQYTVVGDVVRLAWQLGQNTAVTREEILISEPTFKQIKDVVTVEIDQGMEYNLEDRPPMIFYTVLGLKEAVKES